MVGEDEPLKALQFPEKRLKVLERVIKEYPEKVLAKDLAFYRLSLFLRHRSDPSDYGGQSTALPGGGRLDSVDLTRFHRHISASSAFRLATCNVGFRAVSSNC